MGLLYSSGYPKTHYVDRVSLKLPVPTSLCLLRTEIKGIGHYLRPSSDTFCTEQLIDKLVRLRCLAYIFPNMNEVSLTLQKQYQYFFSNKKSEFEQNSEFCKLCIYLLVEGGAFLDRKLLRAIKTAKVTIF